MVNSIRVTGIDPSLTSTGVARVEVSAETPQLWNVERVKSTGKADATLAERDERLDRMAARIVFAAMPADLVVIEAPSLGQGKGTSASQHDRSGLWWLTVRYLRQHGVPVVAVAPKSRAKYATGKGNAGKDDVLTAVIRRYPDVAFSGNDEADAVILAAMGARHLGFDIEAALPLAHLAAMTGVAWPTMPEAVPA